MDTVLPSRRATSPMASESCLPRTSVQKTGPGLPRALPVARALRRAPAAAEAFDLAAGAFVHAVVRALLQGERDRHAGRGGGGVESSVPAVGNRVADEQLARRTDGQLRVRDGAEVTPTRPPCLGARRTPRRACRVESLAPAVRDDFVVDGQEPLPQ